MSLSKSSASFLFWCLLVIALPLSPASAQLAPEQDAGWQSDIEGLRHFSGLRCPDVIGAFFRIKVLEGDNVALAGCIYTGRDGMTAVLRKHLQGTGRQEALRYSRNYKSAGFDPISLTGAAASGISFKTRAWTPTTLIETLWYFDGAKADFTLWLTYTLPTQEIDVGPAVSSFTSALARQN
ncbi:hypothetical protein E1180_08760 [Roseibium denhamense]|uniref:Uncharacterized protein n=1 Tax=Roseibium denhamense TaxID=76305 RepID=A0ABY1N8C2_9HYPH|nr:hypothetical protein [Roseibium denhamense]MTI05607.1 hypothetical protein [Roseibium denhamense]SMP03164.1 hypothetical protein SAMN06265374_0514 [Roseibium denhamense]